MEKIRFATIGTSAITERFIDALKTVKGAQLQACYSRDDNRAKDYASAHGASLWFSHVSELFSSPEVDAIYIASPNSLHASQALAALAQGKHVLVEKSFASCKTEAARVFDAASAFGLVAMEAMRNIHGKGPEAIFRACEKLGTIRLANINFSKVSTRYDALLAGERPNLFDPMMSGGALLDIGIYVVEPAIALFGKPLRIHAEGITIKTPWSNQEDPFSVIDLAGSAILKYPNTVVQLGWGKISDDRAPSQIQGEQATIVWDQTSYPRHATLYPHEDKGMLFERMDEQGIQLIPKTEKNDMHYEIATFVEAVQGDDQAIKRVQFYEQVTRDSLATMDEIRKQLGVEFPADKLWCQDETQNKDDA